MVSLLHLYAGILQWIAGFTRHERLGPARRQTSRSYLMKLSGMHYFPLARPFLLALVVLFATLVVLVEVGILKICLRAHGIPPRSAAI